MEKGNLVGRVLRGFEKRLDVVKGLSDEHKELLYNLLRWELEKNTGIHFDDFSSKYHNDMIYATVAMICMDQDNPGILDKMVDETKKPDEAEEL